MQTPLWVRVQYLKDSSHLLNVSWLCILMPTFSQKWHFDFRNLQSFRGWSVPPHESHTRFSLWWNVWRRCAWWTSANWCTLVGRTFLESVVSGSWDLAVFVASSTSEAIATASVKITSAFFLKIALRTPSLLTAQVSKASSKGFEIEGKSHVADCKQGKATPLFFSKQQWKLFHHVGNLFLVLFLHNSQEFSDVWICHFFAKISTVSLWLYR